MNPPIRSFPKKDPATDRPRDSKYNSSFFLCVFHICVHHYFEISTDYHFRTRLSQSPMMATQMSLSPVSLRRWNQIGNQQKKVVCRSATVDAKLNKLSYLLYLVCRWTASSAPQLWRRSMIDPDALNQGCFLIFCQFLVSAELSQAVQSILSVCVIPTGLYSRLANLFASGQH